MPNLIFPKEINYSADGCPTGMVHIIATLLLDCLSQHV
jgi:hypothetical protein